MAYNSAIPQATDALSVSQGQILGNFSGVGAIGGNGTLGSAGLNVVPGVGWNYLFMQPQTIPPIAFGTTLGLYAAARSTINELYINKEINVATVKSTVQIPSTAGLFGSVSLPDNGYSYLPSGIILNWGIVTATGGSNKNINFTSPNLNFPSACFNVLLTPATILPTGFMYWISAKGQTLATISFNQTLGTSISFYWLAIGY